MYINKNNTTAESKKGNYAGALELLQRLINHLLVL